MMADPTAVIHAFGGMSAMARALGHRHVTTIQGWKKAGRIPPWRHLEVIEAARREGVALPPGQNPDPAEEVA